MKTPAISFLVLLCMLYSGHCQEPEIILNDLLVSNAYKTYERIDSIYYFSGHLGDFDRELWRTNGTAEGTYRVANINSEESAWPGELTRVENKLYFMASDDNGSEQLYLSDGTEEGTQWVFDVDPEAKEQYHMLTASGGLLYFRTNRPQIFTELWVSDGTTENTHMVADLCENMISYPHELTDFNGTLIFIAEDCARGGETLYSTKGIDGTVSQVGGYLVRALMTTNDQLYFVSTSEDYGGELSSSAGTVADVSRISDINPGEGSSDIYHITQVDSLLLFRAYDPDHGAELWSYNLNSAIVNLVKDISISPDASNSSFPDQLISFKGKLFFKANDGVHGDELWISDGTEEGTFMLKNIREEQGEVIYHSYPQKFFATEDQLYFMADDGIHGPELWQTDGTAEGTRMTADIWPRSNEGSDPGSFAEIGDYLVFNAWYGKRTLFRLKIHNTSTVGAKESLAGTSLFRLYPNPAQSSIIIEPGTRTEIHYRILDISGRELMNGSVRDGSRTHLDLSSLRSGIYIIHGESDHTSQTIKFTKE